MSNKSIEETQDSTSSKKLKGLFDFDGDGHIKSSKNPFGKLDTPMPTSQPMGMEISRLPSIGVSKKVVVSPRHGFHEIP